MRIYKSIFPVVVCSVLAIVSLWPSVAGAADLRLALPPAVYGVVGTEIGLYFDNVVLTQTPEQYKFQVDCKVGETKQRHWRVVPEPNDVGTHPLTLTVTNKDGQRVARASTKLHVVPRDAGKGAGSGGTVRLMIVGDSLTHATAYPNSLAQRLGSPGNPQWKMLGTHKTRNAAEGVVHEGYGGWTWERFVTKYEPNPDGTYRKRSSPFVFLGADGKPELNVKRYFETSTDGQRPDIVFFLLGINDCFGANPDDPAAIDARIDGMLGHAEKLLEAFRKASPETHLAICITTPPNVREAAFQANYKGRYHRWGWKRIQHRLVERLPAHFGERAGENKDGKRLHLVPTHLYLDLVDGYPENNGVHPNTTGYGQIGASLYCWLKWKLAEG